MSDQLTGTCKYCGQIQVVERQEVEEIMLHCGVDEEAACFIAASRGCDCGEAHIHRKREEKLKAAGAWIDNMFKDREDVANVMITATKAVVEHEVTKVKVTIGKHDYSVDLDKDDCLRIKTKYTNKDEETF